MYAAAAAGILLSDLLVLEVMAPAPVHAQDHPLIFHPPRPVGAGPRGDLRPFGAPEGDGVAADPSRDPAAIPPPAGPGPAPLTPPETPSSGPLTGEAGRPGGGTGGDRAGGLPRGNCLSGCGDPQGAGGSGDGWGPASDGAYPEGSPGLTPPRLIESTRILPAYPGIARRAGLQGSVILRIVVRQDGTVGAIEVLRSPDPRLGFDLAAVEAVKQWRYEPARLGILTVAVQMSVIVEFVISR
jgi:protein TonB